MERKKIPKLSNVLLLKKLRAGVDRAEYEAIGLWKRGSERKDSFDFKCAMDEINAIKDLRDRLEEGARYCESAIIKIDEEITKYEEITCQN